MISGLELIELIVLVIWRLEILSESGTIVDLVVLDVLVYKSLVVLVNWLIDIQLSYVVLVLSAVLVVFSVWRGECSDTRGNSFFNKIWVLIYLIVSVTNRHSMKLVLVNSYWTVSVLSFSDTIGNSLALFVSVFACTALWSHIVLYWWYWAVIGCVLGIIASLQAQILWIVRC